MARYREAPRCYSCNEVIAEAIYDEKLLNSDFIGDAFERWEYLKHECKGKETKTSNHIALNIGGVIKSTCPECKSDNVINNSKYPGLWCVDCHKWQDVL